MSSQPKSNGPGKYDWLASGVRQQSNAELVVVLVLGGSLGNGFSVQAVAPEYLQKLPDMLENMARQIREGTA
jgi:hypothetical protein